jgi:hypothetical protein
MLDAVIGVVEVAPAIPLRATFTLKSIDVGLLDGVTVTVRVSVALPPPAPWLNVGWLKAADTVGPVELRLGQAVGI